MKPKLKVVNVQALKAANLIMKWMDHPHAGIGWETENLFTVKVVAS